MLKMRVLPVLLAVIVLFSTSAAADTVRPLLFSEYIEAPPATAGLQTSWCVMQSNSEYSPNSAYVLPDWVTDVTSAPETEVFRNTAPQDGHASERGRSHLRGRRWRSGVNDGQAPDELASVPEPASLLLLGFGLVALAAFRRTSTT